MPQKHKFRLIPASGGAFTVEMKIGAGWYQVARFSSPKLLAAINDGGRRQKRRAAWKVTLGSMFGRWKQYNKPQTLDPWDVWAATRGASWRNRSMAIIRHIKKDPERIHDTQFVLGRDRKIVDSWDGVLKRLCHQNQYGWRHLDAWGKWLVNTCGNHRKRQRTRAERAANRRSNTEEVAATT